MIVKNYNSQGAEYHNSRPVTAVYKGLELVWNAIKSCFGKGYWINDKPWVNNDAWKNS